MKKDSQPFLTIITATYNRKLLLQQAYESLKHQSDKDFVWLIVDDGSSDGTTEAVKQWMEENVIQIEYVGQKNMGVTVARNVARLYASTEWITGLDSDDYYVNDFVKKMKWYIRTYQECMKDDCAGFMFPVIGQGKADIVEGKHSLMEQYYKFNMIGEYQTVVKTDIEKRFLSATFVGETFVTESAYLRRIDYYYHYLCFREYFMRRDYRNDGITQNINTFTEKNVKGYAYALKADAAYCTSMGSVRRAKMYSDYRAVAKSNIFPEIEIPAKIRMLSFFLYRKKGRAESLLLGLKYAFPYKKIGRHSNIVMWGAGTVGQAYEQFMDKMHWGNLILWVDSNYSRKRLLGLDILPPAYVKEYYKMADYILIAVFSDNEAKAIENKLLEMNVERNKIVYGCKRK